MLETFAPRDQRAQGMPGAQCTRSLACDRNKAHERSHHGHTGITRHSPRNGFTAYTALSPATNSPCHRHPRIKVLSTRSGRLASTNLTPATGAGTTRFCRPLKRRSSCTPHTAHEVHLALRLPLRAWRHGRARLTFGLHFPHRRLILCVATDARARRSEAT